MKQLERRKKALVRLEAQLKSGVKTGIKLRVDSKFAWNIKNILKEKGYPEGVKYEKLDDNFIVLETPLTEKDKKRIQKEISVLKERIPKSELS